MLQFRVDVLAGLFHPHCHGVDLLDVFVLLLLDVSGTELHVLNMEYNSGSDQSEKKG